MTQTDSVEIAAPPGGLRAGGRLLWKQTVDEFELDEHELGLLAQACFTLDTIDSLQRRVNRDGVMYKSPQGLRAHPAVVELRQQRITFARLVAQLGVPTGDQDVSAKPIVKQRRSTRGPYGITGVVS